MFHFLYKQLYHQRRPSDIETNSQDGDTDNNPQQDHHGDNEEEEYQPILPKRYVLLLMIFLGFAVVYSLRVNINVAIVAMVNNRTSLTRSGQIRIHVSSHIRTSHDDT